MLSKIKQFSASLTVLFFLIGPVSNVYAVLPAEPGAGSAGSTQECSFGPGSFFGFPHWYQYLNGKRTYTTAYNSSNVLVNSGAICTPSISGINDIWLIVAAIINILLRIAAIGAVVMLVVGGAQFITSQGNPDGVKKARGTILNAILGLALSIAATAIITFIAGGFDS